LSEFLSFHILGIVQLCLRALNVFHNLECTLRLILVNIELKTAMRAEKALLSKKFHNARMYRMSAHRAFEAWCLLIVHHNYSFLT
jgi:hypothetical protein